MQSHNSTHKIPLLDGIRRLGNQVLISHPLTQRQTRNLQHQHERPLSLPQISPQHIDTRLQKRPFRLFGLRQFDLTTTQAFTASKLLTSLDEFFVNFIKDSLAHGGGSFRRLQAALTEDTDSITGGFLGHQFTQLMQDTRCQGDVVSDRANPL